ncbi:MAG: glycogen/starch/alpha-glucan phosphorylase [Clostridia bacterium]|nr:glycogen/starch/alpha-glucan phosphorylase [Clostridia bacterium]
MTSENIRKLLDETSIRLFGHNMTDANDHQRYKVLCTILADGLLDKSRRFEENCDKTGRKRAAYLSMEFLVGPNLRNALHNSGLTEDYRKALALCGADLDRLIELDPDPGLGNGGLGRLASCYMDAATGMDMPVTGYSIRYEFGIFRQKIVDGWQMEFPDDWLSLGGQWLHTREEDAVEVRFGGYVTLKDQDGHLTPEYHDYHSVIAVPSDMFITGYGTDSVNRLVLWSCKSKNSFDMSTFSRGDYVKALEENTMAEVISKVLYPADNHEAGKRLRIRQQYVMCSATLQTILRDHVANYGSLDTLPDKMAVHINDTHPAMCVPELMRLLLDEYGYTWEKAWSICCRTLSYTNHTVMSEALERWNLELFRSELPRICQICEEIDRRARARFSSAYPGDLARIDYMAPIAHGELRMANLCLCCCHTVNGVSQLHSQILCDSIFRDFARIEPEKFTNVTNGIAYRRWLCQGNPALTSLLSALIGDDFKKDASKLRDLERYADDQSVLEAIRGVKRQNKERLASIIRERNGVVVSPDAIFDIQIKRLHEYKRQLLNALHLLHLYRTLKEHPEIEMPPRVFIFGAKASAGYLMAKRIIRLIVAIADTVNADPAVRDKLKVVFLEDYKVSLAEKIIPAADISEQISVAGKEASGTGNMKLMINGAVTLGTLDGANVEICQQVGEENMFLFGLHADEVEALWQRGYDPMHFVATDPDLSAVIGMLRSDILGTRFDDIADSLTNGWGGTADCYMCLADFAAYRNAQKRVAETCAKPDVFTRMSLINTARAGIFSSDRAVAEYADRIWML